MLHVDFRNLFNRDHGQQAFGKLIEGMSQATGLDWSLKNTTVRIEICFMNVRHVSVARKYVQYRASFRKSVTNVIHGHYVSLRKIDVCVAKLVRGL